MADVVEVVFEFAESVLEVCSVGVVDLRPAGDAGFEEVAKVVAGDGGFVVADEFVPLGAWADHTHVAEEDVEELGEFVESAGAQEASDAGDAGVGGLGVFIARLLGGAAAHGAQFVEFEGAAVLADAGLGEEDGAAIFEPDSERTESHEGEGEEESEAGEEDVAEAFDVLEDGDAGDGEAVLKGPVVVEAVEADFAPIGLVKAFAGGDGRAVEVGLSEALGERVGEVVLGIVAQDDGVDGELTGFDFAEQGFERLGGGIVEERRGLERDRSRSGRSASRGLLGEGEEERLGDSGLSTLGLEGMGAGGSADKDDRVRLPECADAGVTDSSIREGEWRECGEGEKDDAATAGKSVSSGLENVEGEKCTKEGSEECDEMLAGVVHAEHVGARRVAVD